MRGTTAARSPRRSAPIGRRAAESMCTSTSSLVLRDAVYAAGSGPAIGRYPDWSPETRARPHGCKRPSRLPSRRSPSRACSSHKLPPARTRRAGATNLCGRTVGALAAALRRLALVPMQDMDDAVAEIRYCSETLRFAGTCLFRPAMARSFSAIRASIGARGAQSAPTRSFSSIPHIIPRPPHRSAVARLHDGIPVRYHARGPVICCCPGMDPSRASASSSPMPAACCPIRLASFGCADDRSRLPQWPRERILAGLRRYWFRQRAVPRPGTWARSPRSPRPTRPLRQRAGPSRRHASPPRRSKDYTAGRFPYPAGTCRIDRGNAVALFRNSRDRNVGPFRGPHFRLSAGRIMDVIGPGQTLRQHMVGA